MLWSLLLGDLPELPEHGPGDPALSAPASAEVAPDGPRDPSNPSYYSAYLRQGLLVVQSHAKVSECKTSAKYEIILISVRSPLYPMSF